ncbi:low affinity immunoglobulin gamma Fc region receptor II-a isoform X2 [Lates calcarifer]|uniref:low affinity immunoglobulin gamma Fc region receptor II-a isoform X2 n=1 Tax=Lates calcarifer TaxID=8187 RepID=UPI0008756EA4|nr:low affinity immunoglobulin gamma Fc region receptor II-a isoform X2 [Lates calcarifer]
MYLIQQQVRMEVAALCLLLLMNSLDSGQAEVSVTIAPKRSQFLKYENFVVSCVEDEHREEEEETRTGWRVMKRMEDGEVHECLSSCSVAAAFPATDSGLYWCETEWGTTSDAVNITVTGGSVILESPVLPVMEGDNVTLCCRNKDGYLMADFYKDGIPMVTSSTLNVTINSVSKSDEGLYRCDIYGYGSSPESRLTVKAPPGDQVSPAPMLPVSTLLRHLMVGTPYLLSTILLGLIYRDRKKVLQAKEASQPSDVIMEIAV